MSGQIALELPSSQTAEAVIVNERCIIRVAGDQRVVVIAGMPLHHYNADDKVAEAYAMVLLANSGFARQNEIARAFGCSERTVRRHQKRYDRGGMAALATRSGWRPGRRRITNKRMQIIGRMNADGLSNCEIARRLGVTEKAIRKQVGPAKLPIQEVLPLHLKEDTSKQTAETEEQPEENRQAEESDAPMPMSLDTNPLDRTLDRFLACLGLLDDAAPLFGEASAVKGAGVMFAKLEQAYGAAAADNPQTSRPTIRGFKIAHARLGKQLRAARNHLDELLAKRRALPTRVEVRDVSEGAVIKLATERKHLSNIIKMVAYQVESDLISLLRPHYVRADQEGRTLLHELFNASADIEVKGDELCVTLSPLSAPHRTLAVQALSESLNEITTKFPGTNLRLRFHVHPPPRIGLAFPGPNPHTRPTDADSSL